MIFISRVLFFSKKGSERICGERSVSFSALFEKDPTFAGAWLGSRRFGIFLADVLRKTTRGYRVKRSSLEAIALDEKMLKRIATLVKRNVSSTGTWLRDAELKRRTRLDPNSAPAHFFSALLPLFAAS